MPVEMYLDTEFNGHSGELISIAIAADDGSRFYAELPEPRIYRLVLYTRVYANIARRRTSSVWTVLGERPNSLMRWSA